MRHNPRWIHCFDLCLSRELALRDHPMATRIVHVAHDLVLEGHADRERILLARQTWREVQEIDDNWQIHWFNTTGRRASRDIGDSRNVPYINDLFDFAAALAGENGIACWSNLDVCLVPEAPTIIRNKLSANPCCYSCRIDVDDAHTPRHQRDLEGRQVFSGADLFAFRPDWWRSRRSQIPDLFISCEAFDHVLKHMMSRDSPEAEIRPPILYHQRHQSFWMHNRLTNPAQKHNRALAAEWCLSHGVLLPFFHIEQILEQLTVPDRARMHELCKARFDYVRVGYDQRTMSFSITGAVAQGAAGCEMFWWVQNGELVLSNLRGAVTCRLGLNSDGIWEGQWLIGEKMPVRLVPLDAPA